jgi:hypothetical protein
MSIQQSLNVSTSGLLGGYYLIAEMGRLNVTIAPRYTVRISISTLLETQDTRA